MAVARLASSAVLNGDLEQFVLFVPGAKESRRRRTQLSVADVCVASEPKVQLDRASSSITGHPLGPDKGRELLRRVLCIICGSTRCGFFLTVAGALFLLYILNSFDAAASTYLESAAVVAALLAVVIGVRLVFSALTVIFSNYSFSGRNIIIDTGIVFKRKLVLPLSQITAIDVKQDLSAVVLGLYDVEISTPSLRSAPLTHLQGMRDRAVAELRAILLAEQRNLLA